MFSIHYSNIHDRKGKKKSLCVPAHIFYKINQECTGRFAPHSDTHFIIEVVDWDKALDIVNNHIKYGGEIYVKLQSPIKL